MVLDPGLNECIIALNRRREFKPTTGSTYMVAPASEINRNLPLEHGKLTGFL